MRNGWNPNGKRRSQSENRFDSAMEAFIDCEEYQRRQEINDGDEGGRRTKVRRNFFKQIEIVNCTVGLNYKRRKLIFCYVVT